jgi:transposase-like protein
MLYARPPECPACGHERIVRRSQQRRTDTAPRGSRAEWSCQLCDYAWSYPVTVRRDLVAEAD